MIYVLRKEFGISAREAMEVMPTWEVDVLLTEYQAAEKARMKREQG